MGATYSPHRDGGGILHFPSATHLHNVDPASAIRQLRRSLSRSPSKGPAFRLITSKSASPSSCSPLSPSPLSSQKRVGSMEINSSYNVTSPSPLAVPFPPSAKKGRANPRKLSPMRGLTRSSSSQRSPIKRGLSDSTNNGNAVPTSPISSGLGTENKTPRSPTPETKSRMDSIPNTTAFGTTEPLLAPHHAFTRFEKGNGYPLEFAAKSSPLKRSDGIMNLDQASLGSPSAKRRSLHGASFSPDFNIFDHEVAALSYTQYDTYNLEDGSKPENSSSAEQSIMFSPLPRRTSSLRRTTLQQRYEKPTFARSRPNTDLAFELATPGQTAPKGRPRISLDSFIPPSARESPFTSQGSLPNASVHTVSNNRKEPYVNPPQLPSRHPLSRTMTQSSSSSSLAEESPTHVPLRQPEQRRPFLEFSKSLPIGVVRPQGREPISHEESEHTTSTETSFATPENYKLARPLPAAFMSTGLISKKNKNMDLIQSDFHKSTTSIMPDTPCKRSNNLPPSVLPPVHQGSGTKTRQNRHSLHSFGTPSTPFNPYMTRRDSATLETGKNIFGSSFSNNGLARRDSFVGIVGDDVPCSPVGKGDIRSGTDTDVSPTPARTTMNENLRQSRQDHDGDETAGSSSDLEVFGHETKRNSVYCKSTPKRTPCRSTDGDGDSVMEESPCAAPRFKSFSSISSYSNRSHLFRKSPVSTSISKTSHTLPYLRVRNIKTKPSPLSPASPLQDHFRQASPRTPHTPQESVLPPDPSGLSISVRRDGLFNQSSNEFSSSASSYPPATPTASRDYFPQYGKQRSSFTPVHKSAPVDVDSTLTSRFDKVEVIGNGEFSQVYRVAQLSKFETQLGSSVLSVPRASSKTELTDQVWAVKKSRNAYIGPRDRRRKLQEVEILKALGHADHAVQLFDSWEHNDHLYIQTEFCEEGTLDVFLDQVGRKARLDDFRIWKIMLELSLGLQHIHDCGFIHLDLKPANILITFEGVLKIADFGMATSWPAQPGIEGEGDREYIGPEILMGQYDKPADVFSLGLIMLEIAGNVMLPDNGASWQRLRAGDMSDVPSLTWSSEASKIFRDSSGKPLANEESFEDMCGSDFGSDDFGSSEFLHRPLIEQQKTNSPFQLMRSGELMSPPDFMVDQNNPEALDRVVRWMISPQPSDRPVVSQVLNTAGVRWVSARRRAGATIYEGNWGPADDVLADDAEMIDV